MLPSNIHSRRGGVPRVPFLLIIIITAIIANENGWMTVEGRTWPRLVQQEGYHDKEEIYSASSPNAKTSLKKNCKTSSNGLSGNLTLEVARNEINSRLSPNPPASLHYGKVKENDDNNSSNTSDVGDYQNFNGNISVGRCNRPPPHNHYHHHHSENSSGSSNSNDGYNGDSEKWWTSNSTNCLAGPFYLGADVNESVYNALCPFADSTATNGKFPIQGVHCGNGGEWYTECSSNRDKKESKSIFTIHKCDDEETFLDSETGECARKSGQGKMHTPPTACSTNRDDEGDAVLHWVLLHVATPDQFHEESEFVGIVEDLQSLEEKHDESRGNDDDNESLQNLCKSTFSTSYHRDHGLHPHPRLCSKYIQCAADGKGSFFVKSCGPGTVFNSELFICDWPVNVPQCSNANDGNELLRRRRTAEAAKKSERLARGLCNFTGIQADPVFCNKYRICSAGGVESVHTCGLGTVFNPLSEVCDFGDEVDCKSKKSDLGTYGCDEGDKYRAPHPDFCNKFVECQGAALTVKTCPPATLYDREAERCDHAFKITCRKPISLEHDVDVNWKNHGHEHSDNGLSEPILKRKRRSLYWSFRTVRNNELNLACEYNYIAPHPRSCNRFVECEEGRIFVKTCGPGTAFNPILGQCDWPHNVREVDPRDCTRYRQCSLRYGYQIRSCPYGQIFDEKTRKCVNATRYQIDRCSIRVTTTTTARPTRRTPSPAISKK